MGRRRAGPSVAREEDTGLAVEILDEEKQGDNQCFSAGKHVAANTYYRLKEIDGLEEKLAHCRQSMEEVDLKLRREKLSPEGRKSLERERNLLMTKADNYEKELSVLRKENRKNAALAVAMALLIALIYTCWTM